MTNITDDIAFGDSTAEVKDKIEDILDFWGKDTSGIAIWGDARNRLNTLLDGTALGSISNGEAASTFVPKINGLNDPEVYISAKLFANDEPGFLLTASPETCFTDTAGTTPAVVGDPVAYWEDLSGNDNHATQPTTANRPILGRKPKGGRRNVWTQSENFGSGDWRKNDVTVSQTGDYWTVTADEIIDNTPRIRRLDQLLPSTGPRLNWVEVKAGTHSRIQLSLHDADTAGGAGPSPAIFELTTGVVVAADGGAEIVDLGDGWFRCVVFNGSDSDHPTGRDRNFAFSMVAPDATSPSASADIRKDWSGTETILLRRAQGEGATEPTPYQRVGSRFDVTEAGKPDRHYLFFGGASDPRWMQTPVITPGTDKVQVFAGIRPFDMSSSGFADNKYVVTTGVGNNDFFLAAPRSSDDEISFRLSGDTGTLLPRGFTFPAMNSYVVNGFGDISADVGFLRVNGTLEDTRTASLGGGDISDNPVFIGTRDGTQQFLNGEISALTTRFGPNLTNNQIELVERFTASKVAEETL